MSNLTPLLHAAADGDDQAFNLVIHVVYSDLERLTLASMLRQFGGRLDRLTLMPGDLLHEAMLRLMKERAAARSRQEFFAISATLISEVIVDYQRRRLAAKRGGREGRGVSLNGSHAPDPAGGPPAAADQTDLLGRLQREMDAMIHDDPRAAEVLAMRAWGRFRRAEIIEMTGMNPTEVDRAWRRGCERIERALEA
ncbi:MAG: ECF-type sigma factor [Phycisphaerales bacterium JB054]